MGEAKRRKAKDPAWGKPQLDYFDFERQCIDFCEDILEQEYDERFHRIGFSGREGYEMQGYTEVHWNPDLEWQIHHETEIRDNDGQYKVITGQGKTLMGAWQDVGKQTEASIEADRLDALKNIQWMHEYYKAGGGSEEFRERYQQKVLKE